MEFRIVKGHAQFYVWDYNFFMEYIIFLWNFNLEKLSKRGTKEKLTIVGIIYNYYNSTVTYRLLVTYRNNL